MVLPSCIPLQPSLEVIVVIFIYIYRILYYFRNSGNIKVIYFICILGAAAQEAVKVITHQFVPFNNTFIFNGISASSVTFNL